MKAGFSLSTETVLGPPGVRISKHFSLQETTSYMVHHRQVNHYSRSVITFNGELKWQRLLKPQQCQLKYCFTNSYNENADLKQVVNK